MAVSNSSEMTIITVYSGEKKSPAKTNADAVPLETSTYGTILQVHLSVYVISEYKLRNYRQFVYFYTQPEDFHSYDLIKSVVTNQRIRAEIVCVEMIELQNEKGFMKEV